MSRRIGRWAYDSTGTLPGDAGWHLDGGPVVLDFFRGNHQCCIGGPRCCRGCYLLAGWPGREHEPVSLYLRDAMEIVEREHDEMVLGALAGIGAP
jgi:hypothetical protein